MMGPELTVLGIAAILQVVQLGLAGASMSRDVGPQWNAGPRDEAVDFSPQTGRLRRAVNNHFEALAFFTIAVLLTVATDRQSPLSATCAWVYLASRVLYVPAYAYGWTPWRSLIWTAGFVATMIMIIRAII